MDKIKGGDTPHIDRSLVEQATAEYLDLPFRCQAMDRTLVDLLLVMELYAFGDEMYNEETFGSGPARSPLKQRSVLAR